MKQFFAGIHAIQFRDNGSGIDHGRAGLRLLWRHGQLRNDILCLCKAQTMIETEVIDGFLNPMTVEAAFLGIDLSEKIVCVRAVQPKGEAELKDGISPN